MIRRPKPWDSQRIFFDIIFYSSDGTEISRRASFVCRKCGHICEWDRESGLFRCVCCGRKLTAYGAVQILDRYDPQFRRLRRFCERKNSNA